MTIEQINEVFTGAPERRTQIITELFQSHERRTLLALLTSREFQQGQEFAGRMKLRHRSQHHRVPTSRGGSDDPVNLANMWTSKHEALHTVFGNRMPHEQIDRLLVLNAPVMKERIRKKIRTLLFTKNLYVPEALTPHPINRKFQAEQLIPLLLEDQRDALQSLITSDEFLELSHPNFPEARRHQNIHHLIPQSRGGPNDPDNMYLWNQPTHEAFHIMFDNRTPDEQIGYLLSLNGPALNQDITRIVRSTLRRTKFYAPHAFEWMEDHDARKKMPPDVEAA